MLNSSQPVPSYTEPSADAELLGLRYREWTLVSIGLTIRRIAPNVYLQKRSTKVMLWIIIQRLVEKMNSETIEAETAASYALNNAPSSVNKQRWQQTFRVTQGHSKPATPARTLATDDGTDSPTPMSRAAKRQRTNGQPAPLVTAPTATLYEEAIAPVTQQLIIPVAALIEASIERQGAGRFASLDGASATQLPRGKTAAQRWAEREAASATHLPCGRTAAQRRAECESASIQGTSTSEPIVNTSISTAQQMNATQVQGTNNNETTVHANQVVQTSLAECGICYATFETNTMKTHPFGTQCRNLESTFYVCEGCATRYVDDIIRQPFGSAIPCIRCQEQLNASDLVNVVGPEVAGRFATHQTMHLLESVETEYRRCPENGCSWGILVHDASTRRIWCQRCIGRSFCANCRVTWHENQTCEQYASTHNNVDEEVRTREYRDLGVRQCQCLGCRDMRIFERRGEDWQARLRAARRIHAEDPAALFQAESALAAERRAAINERIRNNHARVVDRIASTEQPLTDRRIATIQRRAERRVAARRRIADEEARLEQMREDEIAERIMEEIRRTATNLRRSEAATRNAEQAAVPNAPVSAGIAEQAVGTEGRDEEARRIDIQPTDAAPVGGGQRRMTRVKLRRTAAEWELIAANAR